MQTSGNLVKEGSMMILRGAPRPVAHHSLSIAHQLGKNWPEYLIEAWALGCFMISACVFTILFEHPASPLNQAIPNGVVRRGFEGIAMGLTAITLIHSPWGKRSGAHMNPAVTLTFWRLGKTSTVDAIFYVAAQILGGTIGVMMIALAFGAALAAPTVNYVVTQPRPGGALTAFVAELAISFTLMSVVLQATSSARFEKYTGMFAGVLIATFVTVEAPLSGMSMNPARSFASALPAHQWAGFWIYVVAPIIAMQLAALVFLFSSGRERVACAKVQHTSDHRCIHCGYEPQRVGIKQ
jgi:aquaporin Z